MKSVRCRQKGLISIEFAVLGLMFLFIILTVIDAGRWMMTWAVLQEASSRVAQSAAVHDPVNPDLKLIKQAGLFSFVEDDPNRSQVVPGLTTDNFSIGWLNDEGEILESVTCDNYENIQFVVSEITDFKFNFILPVGFMDVLSQFPSMRVVIPGESLGDHPCGP